MQTYYRSKPRRRHTAQFKAEVIAACREQGASVSAVARRFELNYNLMHQWRRGRGVGQVSAQVGDAAGTRHMEFVPVALPAAPTASSAALPMPAEVAQPVRIEVHRGAATIDIRWPTAAASECAAWLWEMLR